LPKSPEARTDLKDNTLSVNVGGMDHTVNHGRIDEKVLTKFFVWMNSQFAKGKACLLEESRHGLQGKGCRSVQLK
jgi:hypothetical protein